FQSVAKMKVPIGVIRVTGYRLSIGPLGVGNPAAFFQGVTMLYPDRSLVRVPPKRGRVVPRRRRPIAQRAGLIGQCDHAWTLRSPHRSRLFPVSPERNISKR